MGYKTVSGVAGAKVDRNYFSKDFDLSRRLSKVKETLDKNNFKELSLFVHHDIDETPTIVLVGKYESSQDQELYRLLDSKEVKRMLPENIVVEWMHGDEDFPKHTFLERYPQY